MATNFTVSVDEVSCPVCRDVCTYPVLLPCSHSVCKDCLQQCWRAGCRKCPLCRRVCPPGTEPPVNLALKNLCERFHQEQEAGGDAETLCSLHGEKLTLFCLVDKQPICAYCVPNLHNLHKCCHLKVAVHNRKSQVRHTETQIKEDFLELHQFLHDEEAARIAALRAEGVKRSLNLNRKMDDVAQKMEALSATIKAIEQEMGKHDVQFLQSYNKTMKQAQCTVQTPDVSGVLIDVAKHLGNLKFQVCQKMVGMAKYRKLFPLFRFMYCFEGAYLKILPAKFKVIV
ncbi:hypothetical protein SKAU_G00045010 [Synaphobranchus kaupii]|uniref:RING-type domain-containing protein n=1 Tax=Synaphobranchus kaupii TaxID=118154 RepID=A0A9Q1J836_SYNKA|nr:hypothetical protein SKAU_G00045010 [Synaphobranchus kaupii]